MNEEQKQQKKQMEEIFQSPELEWKDRKHFMWFPFSFTKYALKNDRLYTDHGFFNTHYDELLLYRVTDICLTRTLAQKMFGTGTLILSTRIDSDKQVVLENIKRPMQVKDIMSEAIEKARISRDLVRKDFFGGNGIDDDEYDGDEYHDML